MTFRRITKTDLSDLLTDARKESPIALAWGAVMAFTLSVKGACAPQGCSSMAMRPHGAGYTIRRQSQHRYMAATSRQGSATSRQGSADIRESPADIRESLTGVRRSLAGPCRSPVDIRRCLADTCVRGRWERN
ncbi:MAG: hypothetical protein LBL06_03800 [Treponema sp.]|nr:hypothetical protein [Treponema sp.]